MKKRTLSILIATVISITILSGCGSSSQKQADTNKSTPTNAQSPDKPKKETTPSDTYPSLGLPYKDALKLWGEPNLVIQEYKDGVGQLNFKNNLILVNFMYGRVWNLTMQFETLKGSGNGLNKQELETYINQLLPRDAKLVSKTKKDNAPAPGYNENQVYMSDSIGKVFQPSDFYDANTGKNQVGMFLVVVEYNEKGEAYGLVMGTGNNP